MPTSSSITSSIRKPFNANKRLLVLLTFFIVLIAGLVAGYYYHIKNNEQNFRETKLQSLDSQFDIISKQLNNDVQTYYSQKDSIANPDGKKKLLADPIIIKDSIWSRWDNPTKNLQYDKEFDEHILIIKDPSNSHTDINKSSFKGSVEPPESLFKSNLLNIGISMPIPEKAMEYQLFGKEYNYETSLNKHIQLKITIIGLVKADRYNESIRKLDPWIIALLTTFLLLSLFGLPYFKMLFIAEDERLSSMDVIGSGISVVVGAPIMVVIFLALVNHHYHYNEIIPHRLKSLSTEIGSRFEKENSDNVNKLYSMSLKMEDSIYGPGSDLHSDRPYQKDGFIPTIFKKPEQISNQKSKPDSGQSCTTPYTNNQLAKNYKFITKIDTVGKSLYHIALVDNANIKNTKSLASRPYFKAIKKSENPWISGNGTEYVMRPVVSIEDQTEEAVYILKNKCDTILPGYRVGASQLKSVHNPILPFGYQFAIIDEEGEVWFHSEEGRATLENFFTVSRQFDNVKGAILGRVNAGGLVNYRDEGKLFNATPIAGTNLSVIALYDVGLIRARISEVLTLASLAIILAFLLMLVITVLSLIIRNPKLGLYKYDRFVFEFLTPKKGERNAYILLSALFSGILLIGIIVGTCCTVPSPKVYIICLLMAMWSYLTVYYTLHSDRNNRHIKFRVRDFLLLALIVFLNVIMLKVNPKNPEFSIPAILVQVCFIGFIILGQLPEKTKNQILYRAKLFSLPNKIKNFYSYNKSKIHISYRYWYSIFLFCWLLLAAVYPAYLVFEKAQDVNDKVWFKSDQIYIAKKHMQNEKKLEVNLPPFEGYDTEYCYLYEDHLTKGLYPDSYKISHYTKAKGFEANDTLFREFLWSARPIYDNRLREFKGLVYEHAQDISWISEENLDDSPLTLNYVDKNGSVQVAGNKEKISMDAQIGFPKLKFIGMLLLLAILFSLILFFVDRFFAFRFRHLEPNDFDADKQHHYIKKFGHMLENEESNYGLLLIGLPFSGKLNFARKVIYSTVYKNIAILSMLRLDNIDNTAESSEILKMLASDSDSADKHTFTWEDKDVFIIEHLEHNIKSFEANHAKLKLISFLISEKKRVVLISEVYPSQIFALYENPPQDSEFPWGSFEDDFNSWRNILSAFPQVLIGITRNRKKVYKLLNIDLRSGNTEEKKTIEPLINELGHSQFLPTLAPVIAAKTLYNTKMPDEKKQRLDRQRMVMQTQNLSHGYYNDIWNALPTRERYLLYDLAKDGFLNIKNRNSLFSLMKKGLVVWDDRPKIFNDSFKNFVVTSVSLNEALRLEKRNKSQGSWGNTRIIFYLIILTIIAFIAMGKPELLKDFETLIGALGGLGVILPLVSKLLASGALK